MKSPTKARIFTAPRQGWLITCVNSRCSISGQPVYTVDREITGQVPFEWAVRMMGVQGKRLGGGAVILRWLLGCSLSFLSRELR